MKIIFAQGNPGDQYSATRHNVGFILLHNYAKSAHASFSDKSKFKAHIAEANVAGEKVLFVLPTTFYNDTGQSLRALADFYKVPLDDILVIHDELALPFGKIRVRRSGSPAGNNGIKSLNSHLGEHYTRIRVGIWSERRELMHDADFVLSRFTDSEKQAIIRNIQPKINTLLDDFVHDKLVETSLSAIDISS